MYTIRSIGKGKWELDGAQHGEHLSGLTIQFMEGKIERNGSTTYYVAGPALASIEVTFPSGQIGNFVNVPVAFD